jgi:hypothetical protein
VGTLDYSRRATISSHEKKYVPLALTRVGQIEIIQYPWVKAAIKWDGAVAIPLMWFVIRHADSLPGKY